MPTETVKVLELSKDNYYVRPESLYANFGCIGNPLRATFFNDHIQAVPFDVTKIFKDAKFVLIKVNWEQVKEQEN